VVTKQRIADRVPPFVQLTYFSHVEDCCPTADIHQRRWKTATTQVT
jgi:hypothetical protein